MKFSRTPADNAVIISLLVSIALLALVSACSPADTSHASSDTTKASTVSAMDYIDGNEIYNPESVIPPQCYTKTEQKHNPCYVCHQSYPAGENRPNMMSDASLQGEYEFSDAGMHNSWKNLFVDRSEHIAKMPDSEINDWVTQDNYQGLITKLKKEQKEGQWLGEIAQIEDLAYPDLAFEINGLAKDGSHWVAFNYKPFPSTFWPTNGSTGDAMIRLPKAFREHKGNYSNDVYFANLALVELAIKDEPSISSLSISEHAVGTDLNGDGVLSDKVTQIIKRSHYVGDAKDVAINAMLYPQDTEFLHTVRYIGVDDAGKIYNAPRFKELRYMRKHAFKSKERMVSSYYAEAKEKHFENLPKTLPIGDKGINNTFGWTINGYIEDADGELRQQAHQELAFCNGCHKTIGSTIDQTFSFPRKLAGKAGWGYIDLTKMQDVPSIAEAGGEYENYMRRVGGGDEFRQNGEMQQKWFRDGKLDEDKLSQAKNLYEIIMPSPHRANQLNKAYYDIMKQQSYLFGRDANIKSAVNVYQNVSDEVIPLPKSKQVQWDMRLDWQPTKALVQQAKAESAALLAAPRY